MLLAGRKAARVFILRRSYTWVTGGIISMRRIKPPIAFLLAFWVQRDIWVRRIPKEQYKTIQGIVDGFRIAAVLRMGNRGYLLCGA